MLLVDANVLLYAVNEGARRHVVARDWLQGALRARDPVAFAWTALVAFVRVATHPAVFARPLSPDAALDTVERWLAAPAAVVLEPTTRHAALLRGLLGETGTGGNLVADAHLAALALEHGATVVSFDRDFARFEGVRHHVPG